MSPSQVDLTVLEYFRFSAEVRDGGGNLVPDADLVWSSSDAAVLGIDPKVGAARAFSEGSTTVTAAFGSYSGTSAVTVLGDQDNGAARITAHHGSGQTAPAGTELPKVIVAQVFDASGNPLAGVTVDWTIVSGNGSVANPSVTTNQNGAAVTRWTLGPVVGTQELRASSGNASVIFTATATGSGGGHVQVSPSSTTLGVGAKQQLTATVVDSLDGSSTATTFTWSSSDTKIATVDSDGLVTAVASGSTTITATSGSYSGTSTVTVVSNNGPARITAHHGSGQTAPVGTRLPLVMVAQVFDAAGDPLPGVTVIWSIVSGSGSVSNSSVTTNFNGAAATQWTLGPVVGTQELRASSGAVSATFTATATANAIDRIQVAPTSATVAAGATQQFTATALDSTGQPVTGVAFVWSTSDPTVASVDSDGLATALAGGSTTVTATAAGEAGSADLTVTGSTSPPPPPSTGTPELPRVYVNTAYQAPGGQRIRVRQGDDLQLAIHQAQRGDIIELDPGATFSGTYTLPAKSGSGWIVIRTNTSLPPQGSRVSPSSASNFAVLQTTSSLPALDIREGASEYRIMGVEIRQRVGAGPAGGIVRVGRGNNTQNTLSAVPHHIIFDRVYVHGNPGQEARRCIQLNAAYAAVIDSYLSECHHSSGDAQAIIAWNTPGPLKIVNNYLEGSGENVMLGGADPKIPNVLPSDVEIRRNHFYKPAAWRSSSYVVKNLLEFKIGRRILVEGNVFENNWAAAQHGYAILIKSANQGGSAPWSVTEHVTFQYNVIRNSSEGINLFRGSNGSLPANTIRIAHNVMDGLGPSSSFGGQGKILQVVGGVDDLTVEHNTFIGHRLTGFTGTAGEIDRLVIRNNVVSGGKYGLTGDGVKEGTATLNKFAPGGWWMSGNVVIGRDPSYYPAGNYFPVDEYAVGFQNYGSGNYRLSSSSPYRGVLNGTDPGADIGQVNAKTSGVN